MEPNATTPCSFDSPGPEATFALAALLGRAIGARGLAIGLVGPLGAGKTHFVKGLAEGLGVDPRLVSSPTFVIAQQYVVPAGPERLHHLDFYRLESEAELESIGFRDLLGPGQVVAVEWLDRFPDALGADRLEVELAPVRGAGEGTPGEGALGPSPDEAALVDTGRRRLRATAYGDAAARVLRDWAERVERLAREGADAIPAGVARGRRSDLAVVVALLGAGLVAAGELRAGAEAPAAACAALAPAPADAVFGGVFGGMFGGVVGGMFGGMVGGSGDDDDGLGPLRVTCADRAAGSDARSASAAYAEHGDASDPRLTGIGRLLDGGAVDPNTASRRLLESLPGIGPGRAAAIVDERTRAPFESAADLERVPGIGPRTRERLAPFLAVPPPVDAGEGSGAASRADAG